MKHEEVMQQIELASHVVSSFKSVKQKFSNIVFYDLEFSGLIGAILKDANCTNVPVIITTSPKDVSRSSLVIILSYSGNTVDVVRFYKEVLKKAKLCICITGGGYLLQNAKKANRIALPEGYHARSSFFMQAFTVMYVLKKLFVLDAPLDTISAALSNFSQNFKAIELSHVLATGVPAIYYWQEMPSIGAIARHNLNTRAKEFVILGEIPQIEYNEVEAFSSKSQRVVPLFVYPAGKKFAYARGVMKTFSLYASKFLSQHSYDLVGETILEQLLRAMMLFEIISDKIAKAKGIDPLSREHVDALKIELRKAEKHKSE